MRKLIYITIESKSNFSKSTNTKITLIKENTSNTNNMRSLSIDIENPIKPPFLGTRIINKESIKLDNLLFYLDKNALFTSQWQLKKGKSQTKEEYIKYLDQIAEPILEKWL